MPEHVVGGAAVEVPTVELVLVAGVTEEDACARLGEVQERGSLGAEDFRRLLQLYDVVGEEECAVIRIHLGGVCCAPRTAAAAAASLLLAATISSTATTLSRRITTVTCSVTRPLAEAESCTPFFLSFCRACHYSFESISLPAMMRGSPGTSCRSSTAFNRPDTFSMVRS